MTTEHVGQLLNKLELFNNTMFGRLILIVGRPGSGKTSIMRGLYDLDTNKFAYINVGLSLSKRLLGVTVQERRLDLMQILLEIVSDQKAEIILIDNTELLFDPKLATDPIKCLTTIKRIKKVIVAAWNGFYNSSDDTITYAEINHPEYRRYKTQDTGAILYTI